MNNCKSNIVLIIDDNVTNLKVAIDHLSNRGLEIITARDGQSGLQRALFAQPDLILLDVQMPVLDGFTACRQLKANEETAAIPVIFMTSLADVEDKVRGFAAGGVDYVTKPIQAEELWARVHTHLTIQQMRKEKEDQIRELDAFAHTVAHDLKNPIARIVGSIELLREILGQSLNEQTKALIDMTSRGSRQMVEIIDELLLLASTRRDEVPLEPVAMEAVVQKALQRLSKMIDDTPAEMVMPPNWPAALGYGPWLEEVWTNYLCNALKYGGRPAQIELGAETQPDGTIRFWVRDYGPGIPAEQQESLFREFNRTANGRSADGHGLGLSIVRRIIDRLNGRVGVCSNLGAGSTFFFELPSATEAESLPQPAMMVP